ncbi:hypothetical protein TYRP_017606 [Tyrophagus putrescentiae]|nr:hypothetical protein TYRP_017606 [Tyrophagus putrescentiae]
MESVTVRHAAIVKITIGKITECVKFLLYDHPSAVILGLDIMLRFHLRVDCFELKQYDSSAIEHTIQLFSQQKGESAVKLVTGTPFKSAKLIEKNQSVLCEYNKRSGVIFGGNCHTHLSIAMPITPHLYCPTLLLQLNINSQVKEFPAKHPIEPSTSPYPILEVMVDKKTDGKNPHEDVLNEKANCTSDASHFATEDRAVVLVPSGKYSGKLQSSRTLKWNLMKCEEEINSDRLIQYKFNCDELYIYYYLPRPKIARCPQIDRLDAVLQIEKQQLDATELNPVLLTGRPLKAVAYFVHSRPDAALVSETSA